MPSQQRVRTPRLRHPLNAYRFLFDALRFTQTHLGRADLPVDEENAHITGQELLDGLRVYARQQFGLLARMVLAQWDIHTTDDIGRMVYELIERGEMRKTDRDDITDFYDHYDLEEAFSDDSSYELDVSHAFKA